MDYRGQRRRPVARDVGVDRWKWAEEIRAATTFARYTMSSGEAIIFGGSSQWHYRAPMPQATRDGFCTLLFFHFVPAGSSALSQPENWADIFGVPELRSFRR